MKIDNESGTYRELIASIARNQHVLHIGCVGTRGVDIKKNFSAHRYLTRHAKSVYGIDIDAEGIALMKQEGFSCEVGSVNTFEAQTLYGVVMFLSVLQFISNPLEAVKQVKKSLKKDGILMIEVPHVYGASSIIRHLWKFDNIKPIQKTGQSDIGEVSLFHAASLANIVTQAGLTPIWTSTYTTKRISADISLKENVRIFVNNFPRYFTRRMGPSLVCIAKNV